MKTGLVNSLIVELVEDSEKSLKDFFRDKDVEKFENGGDSRFEEFFDEEFFEEEDEIQKLKKVQKQKFRNIKNTHKQISPSINPLPIVNTLVEVSKQIKHNGLQLSLLQKTQIYHIQKKLNLSPIEAILLSIIVGNRKSQISKRFLGDFLGIEESQIPNLQLERLVAKKLLTKHLTN